MQEGLFKSRNVEIHIFSDRNGNEIDLTEKVNSWLAKQPDHKYLISISQQNKGTADDPNNKGETSVLVVQGILEN